MRIVCKCAAAFVFSAKALMTYGASTANFPPPGQYQIDSDSVMQTGTGPTVAEINQHTDGATGDITVTRTIAATGKSTAPERHKGTGSVTRCIASKDASAIPTALTPAACRQGSLSPLPNGTRLQTDCNGINQDIKWNRINDQTWEVTYTSKPSNKLAENGAPNATSPQAAINMAMAHMTPDQRARAQAQVASIPSQAQIKQSSTDTIAELEILASKSSPQEAVRIRQQIVALQAQSANSPGNIWRTNVKERWTRVSSNCAQSR